ncbi:MATE family efflux transporter [Sporanaerobium hydrogeniformans]|uniref:MATE family efflux transporter n=1 Tax=Sporanaerobium hydrogeniformans TaxID=3072179 RepID=A0AC61DGA0_9FIRM|nr:MATE family efflux transporter [Sporanaerobium hydrogeniformans]PHV72226.1 MATE family efflux transporter [Sporanaerobium hydrogeniformans]
MKQDLTIGSEKKALLLFAMPLIGGNILQQLYNVVDTWIVGRYVSSEALAAVGTSFALLTFLYSIIIGLCMGSSTAFAMYFGKKDKVLLRRSIFLSGSSIGILTLVLNVLLLVWGDIIIKLMRVDPVLFELTREYLHIIFMGLTAVFIYNFFASIVRSMGNSRVPVLFIALAAALNIILDVLFVKFFNWKIAGAAWATFIAQLVSALGMMGYAWCKVPEVRLKKEDCVWDKELMKQLGSYSLLTSLQQSIMNFGILMIQGLVNSYGVAVTAAFAAVVKIDAFAYMPVQDFGNAFSTFIAQNKGAGKEERIKKGIRFASLLTVLFSGLVSVGVVIGAKELMLIFFEEYQQEIISIGVRYLQIEGACYMGIGILFLLYGFYRGVGRAGMSLVLTIISLGTRVILAYALAPIGGIEMIWWAIPIGWILADAVGIGVLINYINKSKRIIREV